MFSKFAHGSRADIKSTTPLKSSVQRNLKTKLVEIYPKLEPFIDDIMPKKSQMSLVKCEERISLYSVDGKVLFFQHFDDVLLPSLRLVHLYPECFPIVRVDRGAIKFVYVSLYKLLLRLRLLSLQHHCMSSGSMANNLSLSGANIMAPGLTSAGGMLPEGLEAEQPVIITAEGKEHAVAIGVTKMSAAEMKEKNKGIGIEAAHFLGDWLVSYYSRQSVIGANIDSGRLRREITRSVHLHSHARKTAQYTVFL
jgi:PUA domain protein